MTRHTRNEWRHVAKDPSYVPASEVATYEIRVPEYLRFKSEPVVYGGRVGLFGGWLFVITVCAVTIGIAAALPAMPAESFRTLMGVVLITAFVSTLFVGASIAVSILRGGRR